MGVHRADMECITAMMIHLNMMQQSTVDMVQPRAFPVIAAPGHCGPWFWFWIHTMRIIDMLLIVSPMGPDSIKEKVTYFEGGGNKNKNRKKLKE